MPTLPVLIIIPHCSGFVPFHILADMLGEDVYSETAYQQKLNYLYHEGDPYTDALFHVPGATHVSALVSRFVVDVNRRRDAGGLNGVVKLTDFKGIPLYQTDFDLTDARKEERLKRFFDPFHATIDRMLTAKDISFFIDAHSMTPEGPFIGPDTGEPRPAFTVITGGDSKGQALLPDDYTSIPHNLAHEVIDKLEKHFGDIVQDTPGVPNAYWLNDPFSGGGTQRRLSNPANPNYCPGFALEFNRALFLRPDEHGIDQPIPGRIESLNKRFRAFVHDLVPSFQQITQLS